MSQFNPPPPPPPFFLGQWSPLNIPPGGNILFRCPFSAATVCVDAVCTAMYSYKPIEPAPVPQKVRSLKWCPDLGPKTQGDILVTGSHDQSNSRVSFYSASTMRCLGSAAHMGPVTDIQVTTSSGATRIVAGSAWGHVSVYRAEWQAGDGEHDSGGVVLEPEIAIYNILGVDGVPGPELRGFAAINSIAVVPQTPTVLAVSSLGSVAVIDLNKPDDFGVVQAHQQVAARLLDASTLCTAPTTVLGVQVSGYMMRNTRP